MVYIYTSRNKVVGYCFENVRKHRTIQFVRNNCKKRNHKQQKVNVKHESKQQQQQQDERTIWQLAKWNEL